MPAGLLAVMLVVIVLLAVMLVGIVLNEELAQFSFILDIYCV